jgi:hypothetical protein
MDKGFGIAALVLALVAISVPVAGVFVSGLAILLAVIAAFAGDRVYSTATSLIAGVNTFFLSPSVWAMLAGSSQDNSHGGLIALFLACMAAPFVAMMFGKRPPSET